MVLGVSLVLLGCLAGKSWGQATTTTTVTTTQVAGIAVDADGVLRMHQFTDAGGALTRKRIAEALKSLAPDVAKVSESRKISLNRLEAAIAERLARGEQPTDEMRFLAGLLRVKYVFFYPDSGDIVIAGPAEGWAADLSGRVRGATSGDPVVELQDLIVALRAFPPGGAETTVISCSIDPTKEGLANMQEFLRRVPASPALLANPEPLVRGLRESLGLQNVTIKGVSPRTHFAQVLVEADYRMKLIGIGLERTRVKLKSYADLASPGVSNAMQRWYFVPDYDCVRVSEDELAMELVGNSVKLIGADEMVAADGTRVEAARADAAGKRFVDGFTAKYPELAKAVPVYAQLRNLIDLSVAAAFIQRHDYYGRAGWTMELWQNETAFPVQNLSAPAQVETAVAAHVRGNRLMTPIGGGVNIQPRLALNPQHLLADEQGAIKQQHEQVTLDHLKPGQWWWD